MFYVCGGSTDHDGNVAPNDTCDAYRIVDVANRYSYCVLRSCQNSTLSHPLIFKYNK